MEGPVRGLHDPGVRVGEVALGRRSGLRFGGGSVVIVAMSSGKVASNATVSRFFEQTVASPGVFGYGFATLTRELRSRVWEAAGDRNPALKATALDPLIVDLDATLVTSQRQGTAVGTYKGGYGFAPFIASVDYGAATGPGKRSAGNRSTCPSSTRRPTILTNLLRRPTTS